MRDLEEYQTQLSYTVASLDGCDAEPLQYIGAIQSCGHFLGLERATFKVAAVCENLGREWLEQNVNDFLQVKDFGPIAEDMLATLSRNSKLICYFKARPTEHFVLTVRYDAEFVSLDLEAWANQMGPLEYPVDEVKSLVNELDQCVDAETMAHSLVKTLKKVTGFDRVMIYRFDEDWHGQVIAEAKNDSLDPYLHLRYPATDIPPPARALYLNSDFRMVADVAAMPVKVLTRKGIARSEFDLGLSNLRAVSPIHIKYLQNMDVRGSFSLPIKVNEKLWGLAACHSVRGPKHVAKPLRSVCELVARVASGKISDFVAFRRSKHRNQILELTQSLLAKVAAGQTPVEAFAGMERDVLALTGSQSAYLKIGRDERLLGPPVNGELVASVRKLLSTHDRLTAWKTDSLARKLGLAETDPEAAGAFAIPFSLGFEDLLIWFRPELRQEVHWAGKPKTFEKHLSRKDALEPRASFASWSELVKGRSRPWNESDDECAQYLLFNFVQGIFSKAAILSKANKQLEETSKAKDEFIGQVSHELRTPLGVIIGWIDILRDLGSTDAETVRAIDVIDRNAKLQINLINDLLDMSRIISGKLRIDTQPDVSINHLVSEVIDSLKPTAQAKSIELMQEDSAPVTVTADPERLRQVVWNLVINAIKFTPKGGRVSVGLTLANSAYKIHVKDNGAGIAPEHLRAIFERFTQVGVKLPSQTGLGLGLAIVKALAELHGGQVEAHSAGTDRGSEFIVSLPVFALAERGADVDRTAQNSGVTKRLEGLRVLIAEDQIDAAEALAYLIERNGGTTVRVTDGVSALKALRKEAFHLVLSDVGMPNMDGYQLISKWRMLEKERGGTRIPAIALTAYASSRDRTMALSHGFDSHIPKPVDREELLAVIGTLLPGHREV